MDNTKYFFQGFLFVFGLAPAPFTKELRIESKIAQYWDTVATYIYKAFTFETSKKTKP